MAYDPGAIDATLAAAVGDEPALIAELREAFLDGGSDEPHVDPDRLARWREGLVALTGGPDGPIDWPLRDGAGSCCGVWRRS